MVTAIGCAKPVELDKSDQLVESTTEEDAASEDVEVEETGTAEESEGTTASEDVEVEESEEAAVNETTTLEETVEQAGEPEVILNKDVYVIISSSGFSPEELTINKGDSVIFVNEGSSLHWPASAVHPTHTVYPGSDISKCGSGEDIFDACKGLSFDESFKFTFNEVGSWGYHDHLNSGLTGTVVVE